MTESGNPKQGGPRRPAGFVDAHQHFWRADPVHYSWLSPEFGSIFRDFEPAELQPDLGSSGVASTVLVQASNTYRDTHAMLRHADQNSFISAVVGWVPLTDPEESARKLDEEWLTHRAFRGVRHLNHDELDPDWLIRPDVLAGLGQVADRGLTFDVVAVFPLHLRHIATIAQRLPNLVIVIDHLAKPPITSGDLRSWADQMRAAAASPNVVAKVSGLTSIFGHANWTADDLVESISVAVDAFGVDRLMFGSDWPVALLSSTYGREVEATLDALTAVGLSKNETNAVMGATARAVYRITQ